MQILKGAKMLVLHFTHVDLKIPAMPTKSERFDWGPIGILCGRQIELGQSHDLVVAIENVRIWDDYQWQQQLTCSTDSLTVVGVARGGGSGGPEPPNWNPINDKKSIVSSLSVSFSIFACNSAPVQQ